MKIMYRRLHEIALVILIIGIINMYDLFKNLNISLYETININDKNIIYILIITIFFFIIFYNDLNHPVHTSTSTPHIKDMGLRTVRESGPNTMELELILGLGLIGLYVILLSNDLILLFLSLELYSLSVYLLLYKENISNLKISIVYFLIGSISSSLILLGISILYSYSGSLNSDFILQFIELINNYHLSPAVSGAGGVGGGLALIIIGILFKIGAAPFQFWVIRVYTHMDLRILMYQSIIPKIVYLIFLINLFTYAHHGWANDLFMKLLFIAGLASLVIGSIGGLTHTKFKTLMAYSGIFNIGFLLLGLTPSIKYGVPFLNILQYILIYSINTLHIFLAFFIYSSMAKTSGVKNISTFFKNPLFSLSILISIFSFIGLPPFAGFYAKLNIILNLYYTENPIYYMSIIFILITTLIACVLYLKFINSIYLATTDKENTDGKLASSIPNDMEDKNTSYIYIYSLLTIFLISYPFLISYLSPFFEYFSL